MTDHVECRAVRHDGHIAVSSRPGAGATFCVYLLLLDALGLPKVFSSSSAAHVACRVFR